MNIGSHQALVNLIGTDNIVSINTLKDCLQGLNQICNCQKQRKNQKQEQCNAMYINLIILQLSLL
jgi:hypothetical protein